MKQHKRLCIVYWDMGIGGIQKRIRDIILDLSEHYPMWDIYLLLRRRKHESLDDQVNDLKRVQVKYYDVNSLLRFPFGFVFWLGWQLIRIKPTVVLTFQCLLTTVMVIYKYMFFWIRSRLIVNEGAVTSRALAFENKSYLNPLIRIAYPHADTIIVPTRACKDDLVHQYSINKENISVIPNWTLFKPQQPLSHIYDLIYIGRFDPEKNPLFMVELANRLITSHPRIKICMVGSGSLQEQLKEKIIENKLHTHIDILPYSSDISPYLRKSKILVVPSLNEGMPNVVLEAAMCRIPAIINNFPGADEVIVHGKTGYIFTSIREATEFINSILVNNNLRTILGKNSRKNVLKKYSHHNQQEFIQIVTG